MIIIIIMCCNYCSFYYLIIVLITVSLVINTCMFHTVCQNPCLKCTPANKYFTKNEHIKTGMFLSGQLQKIFAVPLSINRIQHQYLLLAISTSTTFLNLEYTMHNMRHYTTLYC